MRHADNFCLWLTRFMPDRLIYWSAIRLCSYATVGKYSDTIVPELTTMDALKRWEADKLRG